MPGDNRKVVGDSGQSVMTDKEKIVLEDPSEYRPELKDMILGKEQDEFRGFYDVRMLHDSNYVLIINSLFNYRRITNVTQLFVRHI